MGATPNRTPIQGFGTKKGSAHAATVVVNQDGSGNALTIAAGIALLPAGGGIVYVEGGTYALAATIATPNKPVTIIGAGRGVTILDLGSNAIAAFTIANDQNYGFRGFTVKGDGTVGQKGFNYTKTAALKTSRFVDVEVGIAGATVEVGIETVAQGIGVAILEDCDFLNGNTATSFLFKANGTFHMRDVVALDSGWDEVNTGSVTLIAYDCDFELQATTLTIGTLNAVRTKIRGNKTLSISARSALLDCDVELAPGAGFTQVAYSVNCDESPVIGCRFSGACDQSLFFATTCDRPLVSHNDFGTDFIVAAVKTESVDGRFTGNTRCEVLEIGTADKNSYIGIDPASTIIGPHSQVDGTIIRTTSPGLTDDSTKGVLIGTEWVDTVLKLSFKCIDNAVGAAVWHQENLQIKRGSYTGDGTTSQSIVIETGFSPQYLKIWLRDTVDNNSIYIAETIPEIMDDNAAGGAAQHLANSAGHRFRTNQIISLDSDGFTVDDNGVDAPPNSSGVLYNYMAIG